MLLHAWKYLNHEKDRKKKKHSENLIFTFHPGGNILRSLLAARKKKKTFYARGVSCIVSRKMKFWFTLVFQSMLWFGLVSVTAACLTRITPDPEVPLRGHLGALQINLESCWKPCLLSGPICYPLCPAHTITAAESQAKVKHVMDVLGREELQRKSRDEEKRRLAIRYPF